MKNSTRKAGHSCEKRKQKNVLWQSFCSLCSNF